MSDMDEVTRHCVDDGTGTYSHNGDQLTSLLNLLKGTQQAA